MKQNLSWFDRMMAALTFAEADEHVKGIEFLSGTDGTEQGKNCAEREAALSADLQRAELQL